MADLNANKEQWKVHIVERERFLGSVIKETKFFNNKQDADTFVKQFNKNYGIGTFYRSTLATYAEPPVLVLG